MKINTIILLIASLSTGMMAGIFFTWTNAVKPGIGKLNDMGYLSAFQSMNRLILNLTFIVIFFAPVILIPLTTVLHYNILPEYKFWILLASTFLYWIGTFGVTIRGNIPLNDLLDKTNLENISTEQAKSLRQSIENKWNRFNFIRTLTSIVAFTLLLLAFL
jgi:uncharacterized membrane protein